MALTKIHKLILQSAGLGAVGPATGASCSIFIAGTGTLAQTYSDRNGATLTANPVIVGSDGYVSVYVESGAYDMTVVSGSSTTSVADILAVDDIIISGPQGEPQFATVAAMISASPLNQKPGTFNWSSCVGRTVKTVVNNSTSNAGGAEYLITTINPGSLSTLVGGIYEGVNHSLGGGIYAKLLHGSTVEPYIFGMISRSSGAIYHNTVMQQILDYAKSVGGLNLDHANRGFSYFVDRPIPLRGWLNMLGDFKMTHAGLLGFPNNRFISIEPTILGAFNADSNNLAFGQTTISVTGNTMQPGEFMMILAGDDPNDPNEERWREIVRVDSVAGAVITFSPPFPGVVSSPARATTVHRFEHPCIGVKIGNVTFLEDNPLKTIDRCIQVRWCIGTSIGDITMSDHSGIAVMDVESYDTTVSSINSMKKRTGAATSYGRPFNAWGNKNCRVGSIFGATNNISGVFVESFADCSFGVINFPAAGVLPANDAAFKVNGQSKVRIGTYHNTSPTSCIGIQVSQSSTCSVDKITGVGAGDLCSVGSFGEPPTYIEFQDGEKYRFVGWCSRTRLLNPSIASSINLTDVSAGNCLATHVSVSVDSPANMSGLWYGRTGFEADILSYANSYNAKQLPWSTNFGGVWPFNSKSHNTYIRFLTGAGWPSNGYLHMNFALYQLI